MAEYKRQVGVAVTAGIILAAFVGVLAITTAPVNVTTASQPSSTTVNETTTASQSSSTITHSGANCLVTDVYTLPLNGTLPTQDLAVETANQSGSMTRLSSSQVLGSLGLTAEELNEIYSAVIDSAMFSSVVSHHIWALQQWGPNVQGYTASMGSSPSQVWQVPDGYTANGALFMFGLWNANGSAFGFAYGTYLFGVDGSSSVNVTFYPEGPGGCLSS